MTSLLTSKLAKQVEYLDWLSWNVRDLQITLSTPMMIASQKKGREVIKEVRLIINGKNNLEDDKVKN